MKAIGEILLCGVLLVTTVVHFIFNLAMFILPFYFVYNLIF